MYDITFYIVKPCCNTLTIHCIVVGEKLPPSIEYYGVDQWSTIQNDVPSPRKEIVHNYVDGLGAIRYGNYKLLVGKLPV